MAEVVEAHWPYFVCLSIVPVVLLSSLEYAEAATVICILGPISMINCWRRAALLRPSSPHRLQFFAIPRLVFRNCRYLLLGRSKGNKTEQSNSDKKNN